MKSMVLVLLHIQTFKKYLISELSNHEETKIEFVNEPQRLSIEHLETHTAATESASP